MKKPKIAQVNWDRVCGTRPANRSAAMGIAYTDEETFEEVAVVRAINSMEDNAAALQKAIFGAEEK